MQSVGHAEEAVPHDITTISHESPFGLTVNNLFYRQQIPSDKLMLLLPGRGYTVEHPVLFHLRYLGLENGFDVLPVQYGYQAANRDLKAEEWPYLAQDVRAAAEPVLSRGYRKVCVVGKSLGTPLALELAQTITAESVSLILLTPIGAVMQAMNNTHLPVLAVIGTDDPLYSPDIVRQQRLNVQWKVLEGLSHGLFIEDNWRVSMDALSEILAVCEQFLRRYAL